MLKVLGREVYGDEKSLIRIDMSEFSDKFDASKLVGAPAGYVGYKDKNKFTDQVRLKPYSIVLLDEIEKAHPDIFNLLLTILEDGYITDATGRVINFKNTIIIMTSNIGNGEFNKYASIGFNNENKNKKEILEEEYSSLKERIISSLPEYFNPEFLNRIDSISVFKTLNLRDASKIAKLQMGELKSRLQDKKIGLDVNEKVYRHIAEKSFNAEMGARPIRRFIQDKIENLIANQVLADQVHSGDKIMINLKNDQISLKKK